MGIGATDSICHEMRGLGSGNCSLSRLFAATIRGMPSKRYKPNRMWWQVSIRELLMFTLIVALIVGWSVDRKRLERQIQRRQDAFLSLSKENVLLQLKLRRILGDKWSP